MPDLAQVIAETPADREALAALREMSLPDVDVTLPGSDALLTQFLSIAVPFADLNPLIAAAGRLREADGQDLLRLLAGGLVSAMGRPVPHRVFRPWVGVSSIRPDTSISTRL